MAGVSSMSLRKKNFFKALVNRELCERLPKIKLSSIAKVGLLSMPLLAVPSLSSAIGPLNDTGITFCGEADSGNNSPCTGSEPFGQDAHYGRDAAAAAGTLTKIGSGHGGFDFTALDVTGQPTTPGTAENPHSCVRDNVTGLIWEVKVNDPNHLRHLGHSYTWYDTHSPDGNAGALGSDNCNGTLAAYSNQCNTEHYVAAVNAAGLCSYTDWRMPTRHELVSIVNFNRVNPAIDTTFFENTLSSVFWSGSPSAADSSSAWGVNFNNGVANYDGRSFSRHVRLVRGGQ